MGGCTGQLPKQRFAPPIGRHSDVTKRLAANLACRRARWRQLVFKREDMMEYFIIDVCELMYIGYDFKIVLRALLAFSSDEIATQCSSVLKILRKCWPGTGDLQKREAQTSPHRQSRPQMSSTGSIGELPTHADWTFSHRPVGVGVRCVLRCFVYDSLPRLVYIQMTSVVFPCAGAISVQKLPAPKGGAAAAAEGSLNQMSSIPAGST